MREEEIAKLQMVATIKFHRMDMFRKVLAPDTLINTLHNSMSPKYNAGSTFKNDVGGRSGSIFFFSHDKKYLVKTMSDTELQYMIKILPLFTTHLLSKKKTLMAKIHGIFTVKTRYVNETRTFNVLLMECCAKLRDPK